MPNLHCAYCGRRVLTFDELKNLSIQMATSKGAELIQLFAGVEKDLDAFGQKMFKKLRETCINHPNKKLGELVEVLRQDNTLAPDLREFIEKHADLQPRYFAKKLLVVMESTADHVHLQSEDGELGKNLVISCLPCNLKRGNTPFDKWVGGHPEIIEKIKKYVDELIEITKNLKNKDKKKSMTEHVLGLIEVLKTESHNLINFNQNKNIV